MHAKLRRTEKYLPTLSALGNQEYKITHKISGNCIVRLFKSETM